MLNRGNQSVHKQSSQKPTRVKAELSELMRVQDPSIRLRCDSLSAHSEQARFLQAEAGNRAQSDNCCGLTLVLKGGSYGETEPGKATYPKEGHTTQSPTSLEHYSRRVIKITAVRVRGFSG